MDNDVTVFDVAGYFINIANEQSPYYITHLKAQKLVYYSLGWYGAIKGERLFNSSVEAWRVGPIFPELYDRLKQFGSYNLRCMLFPVNIKEEQKEVLNAIWNVYGKYNGEDLMNKTILEMIWIKNYSTNEYNEIPYEEIVNYFKDLIDN